MSIWEKKARHAKGNSYCFDPTAGAAGSKRKKLCIDRCNQPESVTVYIHDLD